MTEEETGKRPQFGNRLIKEDSEIFKHNAWDRVEWDAQQEENALEQIRKQIEKSENVEERMKVAGETASENWNCFYEKHENKFFKDRSWLFTEFERLNPKNSPELVVLELGCGNGSNVVPLLEATTSHQNYKVFGCDFAPKSVEICKELVKKYGDRGHIFQHDLASDVAIEIPEKVDVIICTFVLSALPFDRMKNAISKMADCLKPGGDIFFRDYGRYDMSQLRFKPTRVAGENTYTRGDGTLVYFFTEEDVANLFESAGLKREQLLTDRRLQVNRAKRLKMYRVWEQAIYRKEAI